MSEKYELIVRPPREAGAANIIELKPSFMTRAVQAVRYLRDGRTPDWFGPSAPMSPVAPPEIAGREFDFPTAYNLQYSPKYLEGPNYNTLRQLAAAWDLLRTIIETRKDEVCKLQWAIAYKDEKKKPDDRCKVIEDFLAMPDKEHTWEEWLRMLLEDLLVIDAPTLYPRAAMDKSLYSLEPVDGATIKRVIDDWGRTPLPPTPAYQQILKGLPATDYTRDELIYRPRNLRTNRVYGYSPVEQIIVTINIALNRQASQLQYYTDGSTPDLILSVPESWTPEQVRQFKVGWDAALRGNTANKRGTMFVFNGMNAIDTKEKALMSEFDEWLARVVCFAFGQSPQPFIKENNRATAEAAAQASKEQGVASTMAWVSNLMNLLLAKYFMAPDMRFRWKEEDEVEPKVKAEIWDRKVRAGAATLNEWREDDGMDPIEGGDVALVYTASGATPLDRVLNPPDPVAVGPDGKPVAPGAAPGKKPLDRDSTDGKSTRSGKDQPLKKALRPITSEERAFTKAIHKVLRKVRNDVIKSMSDMGLVKAHEIKPLMEIDTVMANLDLAAFGELKVVVETAVAEFGAEAFTKALVEAGVTAEDVMAMANPRAVAYAAARAAELITELEEGTRTLLRGTIVDAITEGWSYPELADELSKSYAFSAQRAATIASYEMNDALTNSQLEAWKESGVVQKSRWVLSDDEGVCTICEGNADQGAVDLGKEFESGDEGPPAHPNCRCSLTPVVE